MARASSIQQLPDDILEQLHTLLRDRRVNQLEVVDYINGMLADRVGNERNMTPDALRVPFDIVQAVTSLMDDPRIKDEPLRWKILGVLYYGTEKVSKSAINRYKLLMDEAGAAVQQQREIASVWIGKLGAAPQGETGKLLNEILRALMMDVTLAVQKLSMGGTIAEDKLPASVDMLKSLTYSLEKLEKASSENLKRDAQIRDAARAEAADVAATEAKRAGMSDDVILRMTAAITQGLTV